MVLTQINFKLTEELKDALGTRAATDGVTESEVIRAALTAYLGIEAVQEPRRARPAVYATEEERKAARRERNAKRRQDAKDNAAVVRELKRIGIKQFLAAQEGQE